MQTDTLMSGRSTPIPEHFVLIRSLQFLKYKFKTKVFWAPLTHFSEQSLLCLFPVLYYRRSAFQCERDLGTSSEKNDITWEFFPRGQTPPHPPSMGTPISKIPLFFLKKIFFIKIKHVLAPQDNFGMQKKTW